MQSRRIFLKPAPPSSPAAAGLSSLTPKAKSLISRHSRLISLNVAPLSSGSVHTPWVHTASDPLRLKLPTNQNVGPDDIAFKRIWRPLHSLPVRQKRKASMRTPFQQTATYFSSPFRVEATLKLTFFPAGMLIFSLVPGRTPVRAAVSLTLNVPIPLRPTLLPACRAVMTHSSMALTASSLCFLVRLVFSMTNSTSWVLAILLLSPALALVTLGVAVFVDFLVMRVACPVSGWKTRHVPKSSVRPKRHKPSELAPV